MRIKILEYLTCNKLVTTIKKGVEGIKTSKGKVMIKETTKGFSEAIISLT